MSYNSILSERDTGFKKNEKKKKTTEASGLNKLEFMTRINKAEMKVWREYTP